MKHATYIGKAVSTNTNTREHEHPTVQWAQPSQTNTTHLPPPKEKMAQEQ